ncbi:hypothetical protein F5Y18DRAFT_331561 [Xylariaceae sp. FL1019]|nr:hypothetical protein F5Y18DRAFT_331561 [Xylariaceae sp. FL1019]
MGANMRTYLLPTPLLLLLEAGLVLATVKNDFSSYPQNSQSCLYNSADKASCSEGETGKDLNQCLCKNNNNFVYDVASCVAKEDPSDLNTVYDMMQSNCAGTGVTLSVSRDAFLSAANAATASQTTSSPSPTSPSPTSPTSPSSPTSSNPSSPTSGSTSDDGLSTGVKIGLGVGIGFGAIALGLLAWFVFAYSRRRRSLRSLRSTDSPDGGESSGYHGAMGAAYGMNEQRQREYAHDNLQQETAELDPVEWKPPAAPAYPANENTHDTKAAQPLLAELSSPMPVELHTTEVHHQRYSDLSPGHRDPGAVSPATYSNDGRTASPVSTTQY